MSAISQARTQPISGFFIQQIIRLLGCILSTMPHLAFARSASEVDPVKSESRALMVGESVVISLSPAESKSIQVEKSTALKAIPQIAGLQLIGLKPGAADIQTSNRRLRVSVLSERQSDSLKFLKVWAAKNPGLKVSVDRGEVILGGKMLHPKSWLGIPNSCPRCLYQAQFEIFPQHENEFRLQLTQLLKKRSLPVPALRLQPEILWSVAKSKTNASLKQLSESLGLRIIQDDESVDVAPLIRTQIFVMEVRRDFTRRYGITWPSSMGATVIPGPVWQLSNLQFSAQALENEGLAKVLASPSILCRSGEEAEFMAGGEFPIKILGIHSQQIIWKNYGISLKVKPKADRSGRISLSLETHISSIDDSRKVDGIPALYTNKVSSHFDLEESATIALSGLIRNEEGRSAQGLPGLTNLPILGALFGSKEFRENRTELVIFVRPEVVDGTIQQAQITAPQGL